MRFNSEIGQAILAYVFMHSRSSVRRDLESLMHKLDLQPEKDAFCGDLQIVGSSTIYFVISRRAGEESEIRLRFRGFFSFDCTMNELC